MEKKVAELQNTVYYGLVALFVLWLVSSVYFVLQANALRSSVEANQIGNDAELSSRLKGIESRLGVLEATTDYPAARMRFYYDSTCSDCNNSYWQAHLLEPPAPGVESVRARLAKKNVVIEMIDVNSAPAPADVKRVPAFYASVKDFQANAELAEYFRGMGDYADVYDGDNALILIPGSGWQQTVLVQGDACSQEGSVHLNRYSPIDCYLCDSADAAEETLKAQLGESLDYSGYCIASDEEEKADCINSVGEEAYDEAMELHALYHLPTVTMRPSYVLDCKYVFQAQNFEELRAKVCNTHEELCGLLSLNSTVIEE